VYEIVACVYLLTARWRVLPMNHPFGGIIFRPRAALLCLLKGSIGIMTSLGKWNTWGDHRVSKRKSLSFGRNLTEFFVGHSVAPKP